MNAIVISLGKLPLSAAGCYGGQWLETPGLDQFAANGFTWDQCYVESPCPRVTRLNWWTGRLQYPVKPTEPTDALPISRLSSSGIATVLIRDTGELIPRDQLESLGFQRIIEIERRDSDTTESVVESAKRWLSKRSSEKPFLLWLDCYGAHEPWYADPTEDLDPDSDLSGESVTSIEQIEAELHDFEVEVTISESIELDQSIDQSEVTDQPDIDLDPEAAKFLGVAARLDAQLGEFLEWLSAERHANSAVIIVTSDVGHTVAQQGLAEDRSAALREPNTHVPLLMRHPSLELAGRSAALVQPIDLLPSVCDVLGQPVPSECDGSSVLPICRLERQSLRDVIRLALPTGERAVRTAEWLLIESVAMDDGDPVPHYTLYSKPDDRWERNDLAKLRDDVVEMLRTQLHN